MRELEGAIAGATRMHKQDSLPVLPPPEGPRALFRARLRELVEKTKPAPARRNVTKYMWVLAASAAAAVVLVLSWPRPDASERTAIPRFDLTPGAVRTVAAADVCAVDLTGNAEVIPAVQQQVFAQYGMPDAEPRAFEVDYLITPALGGSDDIRNLWPQPYGGSLWNAHVKDALEDRLRQMVCSGEIDLATAQREIAVNWIAAYRKYFHTRHPLPQHLQAGRITE
jgi:hypothetical protein